MLEKQVSSCEGKVGFATQRQATIAARRKHDTGRHAYYCHACGAITTGRATRREADADVQWLPATVGTPNDPVEAAA